MRIGLDARPLQEKFGGVKQYTFNLFHALFNLDQKNEYHLFYNSFGTIDLPDFKKYSNVFIHRFRWPNKIFNLSLRLLNFPRLDKLMIQNYKLQTTNYKLDLFFLPNLNFTAFSPGFKYIVTVHDLSFHHFPNFYSLKQQLWHKAINYKKLLQQANKIITVSEHSKNDIVETFNIPENKIEVIYPCLTTTPPHSPIPPEADLPLARQGGGILNEPYILSLGTLEPRKNIESVIEAYKILRKNPPQSPFAKGGGVGDLPKLVIVGPYGWRYKKIFKIVTPEIKNDVIFLNQVSEEEKIALYQNAKLFVFPSFYEGFGLPPLEAASFGIPIIASSTSSLPEVLGDAAFYINPWNVAELAQAMALLLKNNELRAKLSEAGKNQAAKFQNQTSAEKLLRVFEEVAKTY